MYDPSMPLWANLGGLLIMVALSLGFLIYITIRFKREDKRDQRLAEREREDHQRYVGK